MSRVPQPPYPAELLADLHAGNLDPELEARLWPAVREDPDARHYLESLDTLRTSLADLAESERVVRPMPSDIAARLEAFAESLGNEPPATHGNDTLPSAGSAPLVPLGTRGRTARRAAPSASASSSTEPPTARSDAATTVPATGEPERPAPFADPISLDDRRRRRRFATVGAAAAAVLVCIGAAVFVGMRPQNGQPPTAAPPPPANTAPGTELDTAVALRALGRHDAPGRLADPAALTACVRAAGIDTPVLGSTEMRFRDRDDAVLILVGGRDDAQVTALVVGPGCGPGNPELLTPITDIG